MPNDNEFTLRLRRVAKRIPHQKLADRLGIARWLLRNWIYQNSPGEFTRRALEPKLIRIEQELG